ncbi:hypothetical protein E2C01_058547 [Portunus trituberculatus]|uniref:Uncharacterized protein n=1 Tax=Portunus trituberculatus TaxID=210409 RepID=A0A5B7GWR6_PORTR|nr:hypothetical protein [Portunus trituberculatus]
MDIFIHSYLNDNTLLTQFHHSFQIDDSNKEIKYDEEARISGSVKATSFIGYFKAGFGWPFLIFFLPMNSIDPPKVEVPLEFYLCQMGGPEEVLC